MIALLALALGLGALGNAAEPAGTSTQAARGAPGPVFGAPLYLDFAFDSRRGAQAQLRYAIRWDLDDLPELPGRVTRLALNPFDTAERAARETLGGARLGFYSLHLRGGDLLPLDALLSPLAFASSWWGAGAPLGEELGVPAQPGPPPASPLQEIRRGRLRLTPIYDELERGARREMRRGLISTSFDLLLPLPGPVPYAQKEAVFQSLREAGTVWEEQFISAPDTFAGP